jgi:hypothetical protein
LACHDYELIGPETLDRLENVLADVEHDPHPGDAPHVNRIGGVLVRMLRLATTGPEGWR